MQPLRSSHMLGWAFWWSPTLLCVTPVSPLVHLEKEWFLWCHIKTASGIRTFLFVSLQKGSHNTNIKAFWVMCSLGSYLQERNKHPGHDKYNVKWQHDLISDVTNKILKALVIKGIYSLISKPPLVRQNCGIVLTGTESTQYRILIYHVPMCSELWFNCFSLNFHTCKERELEDSFLLFLRIIARIIAITFVFIIHCSH